jgi:hypothetical protein
MKRFLPILLLAALMAPQVQAAETPSVLKGLTPMNSSDMSSRHGGTASEDVTMNNLANTNQENYGNSIGGDSYTGKIGNVNISGNSGVNTTIMNTGNQVNISQSNLVNVYLH